MMISSCFIGSGVKLLPEIPYIQVGEVEITPSATATNLGGTFDEHMTSKQHIDKVTLLTPETAVCSECSSKGNTEKEI